MQIARILKYFHLTYQFSQINRLEIKENTIRNSKEKQKIAIHHHKNTELHTSN